jgi:hypothetical protein
MTPAEWLRRFRRYTAWHDAVNREQYVAPAPPWRLVPVDPSAVESLAVVEVQWGFGRVRGGDWDEDLPSVAETKVATGFRQRFDEGRAWEDTDYWDLAAARIEAGHGFHGYDDLTAVREEHCPTVESLYRSVRDDGYRANRGTVYDTVADADSVHDLDPMVLVGRDGAVIWTEGFHRLVVARLLDVEAVPVHVLRRHAEWQARRDALVEGTATRPEVGFDHPDLTDLSPAADDG